LTGFPLPELPFNPVTTSRLPEPQELMAGPLGLLLFLPLVPLVRWLAPRHPHLALLLPTALWLVATLNPLGALAFVGGILAGAAWIVLLGTLRNAGRLGRRPMIALVWIGLHVLVAPLWWWASWPVFGWPAPDGMPVRFAPLHPVGFAYVLLRLIAWGVDWANRPGEPLRARDTLCWLFYAPGLRNGPFLLRDVFLERFAAWRPAAPVAWRPVLRHFGRALLGLTAMGLLGQAVPRIPADGADFFADPAAYSTAALLAVFYCVPVLVYFFLWTYNELAQGTALWVGIPVDANFLSVPRATSPREFWRRWNVNVGAWIRKYIYIPLGGKYAVGPFVFLAAFGYCGIWHGAAWGFVAWPLIQMVALSIQRQWDRYRTWRGWADLPPSRPWLAVCWLLTMHTQMLTVLVFSDFRYAGVRLLPELCGRLLGYR
jgi:D-alanyl-lipoteichoic acid acyltransferase DltB (MBOAT superfamily)